MLKVIPISLKDANAFVAEHHRHHKPVVGHKFSMTGPAPHPSPGIFNDG